MRTLPALLTVVIAVPALVACSAQTAECEIPSGDASSVIEVTGSLGSAPKVEMPTPIVANSTEVSTVIEGEGNRLVPGQPALVEMTLVNGATGEVVQDTGYTGGNLLVAGRDMMPPVSGALECAREGSRIVIAGTAEETHDGQAIPQFGLAADDSLIFVVDVLETFLPKADGVTRAAGNGHPAVVTAPDGRPGITVPNSDAPDELIVSTLKAGDGDEIEEGDLAVLHYTGVLWDDERVFDSSWERGAPSPFQIAEGAVVDGFHQGLVGQKVGSQVLIVIPPELGYGEAGQGSIPAGSTLIFVVDVLGIAGE